MNRSISDSYYTKYCSQCKRFEAIGTIILAAAILLDLVSGGSMTPVSLLIALPGALMLIWGGSSLRPHNVIKAFASQCVQNPSEEFAQGLLDALEANSQIQLVKSSMAMVENAINFYASFEDSDPELAQKLADAYRTRVKKKFF